MTDTLRRVERLDGASWTPMTLKDLTVNDHFRMFEPDGELVPGVWKVLETPVEQAGVWGVYAEPIDQH